MGRWCRLLVRWELDSESFVAAHGRMFVSVGVIVALAIRRRLKDGPRFD